MQYSKHQKKYTDWGIIEHKGKESICRSRKARTLVSMINDKVEKGSKVFTDEWKAYSKLNKDYEHDFVCHSAEEYIKVEVHTNGIENFSATLNGLLQVLNSILVISILTSMLTKQLLDSTIETCLTAQFLVCRLQTQTED